ncbi:MAG TPA: MerR family transcriptional regulator [Ktedonobacterales bacterium]|nr:MerR family transcriptional regulator [Ktedonobacterales bacterium]
MTDDQSAGHANQPTRSDATSRADQSAFDARQTTSERYLRIDEVARRTSLTKRTLRYYEELGLLEPAQRSEGNYRLYSESDVRTLEHIKAMRDLLGLELKEIREMVAAELERERIREQWRTDLNPESRLRALDEVEQVSRRELELLEEKLAGLQEMRSVLLERMEKYQRLRGEIRAQLRTARTGARRDERSDEPQEAGAGA